MSADGSVTQAGSGGATKVERVCIAAVRRQRLASGTLIEQYDGQLWRSVRHALVNPSTCAAFAGFRLPVAVMAHVGPSRLAITGGMRCTRTGRRFRLLCRLLQPFSVADRSHPKVR